MDLTLKRTQSRPDGIFGELRDSADNLIAVTLEHAYPVTTSTEDRAWEPKIPSGTFKCVRGPHRLHGMTEDFETFEITGVPGHSNLLFHWGNFNQDSEGCILLGERTAEEGNGEMITNSRAAFARFMRLQMGVDTFSLSVGS